MPRGDKSQSNRRSPRAASKGAAGRAGAGKGVGRTAKIRDQQNDRDSAGAAPPKGRSFPIVGIGASAGGLEALEQFLKNVPVGSGMAFVVVQHLDPTRKGMMVELLQRSTKMKVLEAKDGMRVQPDRVYAIPPNKDMSILKGVLHLLEPQSHRGLRLPINFFFCSLAEDQQEGSVGVILSGMGTDGTEGLKAVKEKAGAVFVQEPRTAQYDAMPRSAIAAGLADVVAPAAQLPGKIKAYLEHSLPISRKVGDLDEKGLSGMEKVIILLRARTGNDFSLYKKSTIYRRIERRMGLHQVDKIATYVRFLQENPQEIDLLFKELLIGVTSFFRDSEAWEQLRREVIPDLMRANPSRQMFRAWVPGCSSGEEAYSLAMIFKEAAEQLGSGQVFSLQVFGTDLDRDAIDKARTGVYPASISANVSPERLRRFFIEEEHGYRLGKDIREMAIFAPQNVIMDPPFTRLDMIVCRNLLIYLSSELQNKLLPLFHYALNPGGVLFLGSAETIGSATDLFAPLEGKMRIYRRLDTPTRVEPIAFPSVSRSAAAGPADQFKALAPPANLQNLADHLLLQRYAPAAVLVNRQGDILYVSGRTGKYLEAAAGKANWNILAMAREGLRYELSSAFKQAMEAGDAVNVKNLKVGTDGGIQTVDVRIEVIQDLEALRGMAMIVFTDVPTSPESRPARKAGRGMAEGARVTELEKELEQSRQELHTAREEMQTSQEELKSANEELQSTNEELQSTNEELTTSKEELQSLNEELQTVNQELQGKVDELSRASSDMRNLLNSTEIAVVFLDNAFHVRRFTTQASRIIKLIPGDAGRPITDIASDLIYPELIEDAQEVLRSLLPSEKTVATRDGRWYTTRIMPYRTLDNKIDGVVITFLDVTASKRLEAELRETQHQIEDRAGRQAKVLGQTDQLLKADARGSEQRDGDSRSDSSSGG